MKLSSIILENFHDDSLFTFGFDLDEIQYVIDYLKANYSEKDYELHVGRGDTHPNAVTLHNPEMENDTRLGDLLDAAKGSDQTDYEDYRREEDDYYNNELEEGENFSALASAIEKELKDKKPVQEALGVVGVISYILLSNTVAHMISSLAKKIAKKQGWENVENKATAIYDWAHKNEQAFMSPIKRVLSVIMIGKSKKYIEPVTKGLYAILIFGMAGTYGGEAITQLRNSKWGAGIFNTLKSFIKGKEVHTIFQNILSDIGLG